MVSGLKINLFCGQLGAFFLCLRAHFSSSGTRCLRWTQNCSELTLRRSRFKISCFHLQTGKKKIMSFHMFASVLSILCFSVLLNKTAPV